MIMNFEECVNTHALCFERRTRVLEAKFLIYLHYGVWGRYSKDPKMACMFLFAVKLEVFLSKK